jgi:hypothetical protein
MSEDRKAAPISLRRRQAPRPSFDRIGEIAAALSSGDSQYPAVARRAVASCDQEPAAESANEGGGAGVPSSEPTSRALAGDKEQPPAKTEPPASQGMPSRRVRMRCEPEELRALRAYAALQGVPLSDLLSEALRPLVEKAVAAMRR